MGGEWGGEWGGGVSGGMCLSVRCQQLNPFKSAHKGVN